MSGVAQPARGATAAMPAWRRAAGLLAAFIGLSLVWSLPVEPGALGTPAMLRVAGEIALLFGLIALLPPLRRGWTGRALRYAVALATTLVLILKLADLVIHASLARPLNPLLDLHLAPSLVHLLTGTLGDALGWLALTGLAALPLAVFLLTLLAVGMAQRVLEERRWRWVTLGGAALAAVLLIAGAFVPPAFERYRPVVLHASRTLAGQWQRSREMLAELAEFGRAARADCFRDMPADRLLAGLGGADVLLMFIESYGRSALEQGRYAATLVPRLEAFERRLTEAGLFAASGWLTSPTAGGQSWLAYGTVQSGLWLAHQRHYDLLLIDDDRLTLTKAFDRAGYRTIAVKPAITMPWPEGQRFGYERIYAAADLGYAGLPYNWVTMPDQYTLSALERLERRQTDGAGRRPLFAEVSLISSHAPWTPIPPVLDDWSAIDDGVVFSRWAEMGDPPEVVWRDAERVREQYTLALDYVLGVLASYAAEFIGEDTLLILVGDHQPAPLITGEGASRDVPIHVISGAPELLEPFREWGFAPGMRPAGAPSRRMDDFRDWFLGTFSDRGERGS